MRSIFTISTIAASALFFTAATDLASADDDIAVHDLSPQQVEAYKAGSAKQSSLQVTASVDRKDATYAKGEAVKLKVKVNEDAYVAIYNVGPTGKLTLLFPNKFQKEGMIKAGHDAQVPPAGSKTEIKVTGDTGAELIKVVASNKPLKIISGVVMSDDQVFMPIKQDLEKFNNDLSLAASEAPEAEKWSIVNLAIKTVSSR